MHAIARTRLFVQLGHVMAEQLQLRPVAAGVEVTLPLKTVDVSSPQNLGKERMDDG
jgi:hypothetical protein